MSNIRRMYGNLGKKFPKRKDKTLIGSMTGNKKLMCDCCDLDKPKRWTRQQEKKELEEILAALEDEDW